MVDLLDRSEEKIEALEAKVAQLETFIATQLSINQKILDQLTDLKGDKPTSLLLPDRFN